MMEWDIARPRVRCEWKVRKQQVRPGVSKVA